MKYSTTYVEDLSKAQSSCPELFKLNGKKILITGATGLVCSVVVDFIMNYNEKNDAGITVYATSRDVERCKKRFDKYLSREDIVFVKYDALCNVEWDFDVDYIVCGAGLANPTMYARKPVETMFSNIKGLSNILDYGRKCGSQRVLFVSSSEIYGKKENNQPYRDDEYGYVDLLNPRACYPMAKRACETLCAAYYSEYGVETVIARPGHIYGPTATEADTRASSQFFFDVKNGKNIVMKSAGAQLRSYCYAVDCASAIITILLSGVPGKAYNISNPDSVVTIAGLAQTIANKSGKKVVFENATEEEKKGYNLMDNSSLDSTSLLDLGWKGLFNVDDGVEHTLKIYNGI